MNHNARTTVDAEGRAEMMAWLNRLGCVVLVTIVGAAVVGCAGSLPSTTGALALGSRSPPALAQDTDDHFRLVFELPKTTWRTTEEVAGTATLTLVTPASMTVWGSGAGILGFEFAEVGGDKNVGWIPHTGKVQLSPVDWAAPRCRRSRDRPGRSCPPGSGRPERQSPPRNTLRAHRSNPRRRWSRA